MTIRLATSRDAAALSRFGRAVYTATFAGDNSAENLDRYLDSAYVEARQLEEVDDPAIDTLLLEHESRLVAFAQVRLHPPPPCVTGPAPVELWRFYVDPVWHGRGPAGTLMAAVVRQAGIREAATLWLGVWERNVRAQAFYRKHGFVVAGSQTFMMGDDAQRDLVMVRAL